ncbi:MAG: hypothetical protein WC742_12525 [Gallionellaceae bacterium]|jgi:hypothetical protein
MKSIESYPLPPEYPFPPGLVWAAIKDGKLVNMAYMKAPEGVSYGFYRQQMRGGLAKEGKVMSGEVRGNCFYPRVEK